MLEATPISVLFVTCCVYAAAGMTKDIYDNRYSCSRQPFADLLRVQGTNLILVEGSKDVGAPKTPGESVSGNRHGVTSSSPEFLAITGSFQRCVSLAVLAEDSHAHFLECIPPALEPCLKSTEFEACIRALSTTASILGADLLRENVNRLDVNGITSEVQRRRQICLAEFAGEPLAQCQLTVELYYLESAILSLSAR